MVSSNSIVSSYLGTRLSPPRKVVGSNSNMEEISFPSGTDTREYAIFSWASRKPLLEASCSGSSCRRSPITYSQTKPSRPSCLALHRCALWFVDIALNHSEHWLRWLRFRVPVKVKVAPLVKHCFAFPSVNNFWAFLGYKHNKSSTREVVSCSVPRDSTSPSCSPTAHQDSEQF